MDLSEFVFPSSTPVSKLECSIAFNGLTDREKFYAYHLSRASWDGSLICLLQTSPESAPLFLLLQRLLSSQSLESLKDTAVTACGLTVDEFEAFILYAAAFFNNMGNYKSFGDTKFVPDLSEEKLHLLISASVAYKTDQMAMEGLWEAVSGSIFSLEPHLRHLAFPPEGLTAYYSGNCSDEDASLVQDFMTEKNIGAYNTRLFKTVSEEKTKYELRLASALKTDDPCDSDDGTANLLGEHQFKGHSICVTRGDYAPLMKRVAESLTKAKKYGNDCEAAMLDGYVKSFTTGSMEDHKRGSRHWISNKGPAVETYIGFIESYRDPFGVRGEYEGFVSVVNKEQSAKFAQLVSFAENFISFLPWPREFEKDKFLRPDFTSLDVLTFASSGIPAGINIPNYDDIRQNEGFKNVSLGNVLSASAVDKRVTFIGQDEQDLYVSKRSDAFQVQVGLHELLGHGSGKLLQQDDDGQLNFDMAAVINPLTEEKVSSWYAPRETWDSKFSSVASSYEECRAECVGLYLCTINDILNVFGYEGSSCEEISYINWLHMVRAGLMGLEYYSPDSGRWRQAHMQARYVILRVLLEAGGVVHIKETIGADGKPDLEVRLQRDTILTIGRPAIGEFLKKLQVYKSTADVTKGTAMYRRYSIVTNKELAMREIVLARKLPRRVFVQPHLSINDGQVQLVEFDSSTEGIIQSFLSWFPDRENDLEALWHQDKHFWN